MRVTVITPPTPILTPADAKRQLRIEHADDDLLITSLIAVATGTIDGPDGWLGRAIGPQTLELIQDGFWARGRADIELPYPPLIEVLSVRYDDANGAEQTVSAAGYGILAGRALYPKAGVSWPSSYSRPGGVRVRYRAGYQTVPAPIRHAILMMVTRLYSARGEAMASNLVDDPTVNALLAPFRVWSL